MSWTTPDFADEVIRLLERDGYRISCGDGYGEYDPNIGPPCGYEHGDGAELGMTYEPVIDGFWFTFTLDGDVEVGPTRKSLHEAWFDAFVHRLHNASDPDLKFPSVNPDL